MRAILFALTLASYADSVLLGTSEEPVTPLRLSAELLQPGREGELLKAFGGGRKGSAPISPVAEQFDANPYANQTADAQKWGDDIVKAFNICPGVIQQCKGVTSFDDYTWCALAMPQLRAGAKNQGEGVVEVGDVSGPGHVDGKAITALSYGVHGRDLWSEMLSNRYQIKSELFGCGDGLRTIGPFGEFDLTNPDMGTELCPPWEKESCYDAPYKLHGLRGCLGTSEDVGSELWDGISGTMHFSTLDNALENRPDKSVHLKLDVAGHEWEPLFDLLGNETSVRKVRTIDMKLHFNMYYKRGWTQEGKVQGVAAPRMAREVDILKRLVRRFAVVGSTVPLRHAGMKLQMDEKLRENPQKKFKEPFIYPKNGLDLSELVVSLVNKDLLDPELLRLCD